MSKPNDDKIRDYVLRCRQEADEAKRDRMDLNRDNYDMYHLRHDFSHKQEGQSREVLSKLKMAVEQTTSFFQQALADIGEWWRVVPANGKDDPTMPIRPQEIQDITNYMLKKAKYFNHVGNNVQSALLGALSVSKVYGHDVPKPKYEVKKKGRGKAYTKTLQKVEDDTWELCLSNIRQENYYPDPTGAKLYEIVDSYVDMSVVKDYAQEDDEDDYAPYDAAAVAGLTPWGMGTDIQEFRKSRETGQNQPAGTFRPMIKLTTFYGNVVDLETGDLTHENVWITLANDTILIQKPTPNPRWHQGSDIVAAPLLKVANSVWHTALCDAGTKHNNALIEMYNLVFDSAMMSVHGVKQIRVDCLEDPSQVSDGIRAGVALKVNSLLPPGMKVVETVVTGQVSNESLQVLNITQQEFNASMLTTDLRQGVMPTRSVKATEVVESSNTITSVFAGIAKNVETNMIQPELELAWKTTAQNWDGIAKEVFVGLFGTERGEQLFQMDPEDVFAATVGNVAFEVFGLTLTMSKASDFRKLTTLLQTVSSSEVLIEEFIKKYSFEKFLGEIMSSLDINKKKIEVDQANPAQAPAGSPQPEQGGPEGATTGVPNQMSQTPNAGAPGGSGGAFADAFGGGASFPGSPATKGQGAH